jgi:oxygen-independent coproporphyrinogen-3 oxidase
MAGVYISFPFCAQKCTYCNFASGVFPAALRADYLAALHAEIAAERWAGPPDTLYLGGGTPSLLDPSELEPLLASFAPVRWREATMEAAPGSITAERAAAWRRLGFDRVSLGVQSFVPAEIAATGRKHTAARVAEEMALLRDAGFEKINVDLIAGLAHQTPASWRESLEWVARLSPPHVSVYMLEVDDESRLGREILAGGARYGASDRLADDAVAELYLAAVEFLLGLGLHRYEISNFARPGCESVHNLKYWRLEPYRGFGADAHSYDGAWRWSNVESPQDYVNCWRAGQPFILHWDPVDRSRSMEEHFFVGLRQDAGIEPDAEEWRRFAVPIRRLTDDGLLLHEGSRLRLTGRGVLLSNLVFEEFIA